MPYVHEAFELVGGCTCIGAECAVRAAERREFEMPLRSAVIRFPEEADRDKREQAVTEVAAIRSEAICRAMAVRGKSHQVAVRALAFKWIRILFRCWQDRRPYDESVYLCALQRRGSPLFKYLADST